MHDRGYYCFPDNFDVLNKSNLRTTHSIPESSNYGERRRVIHLVGVEPPENSVTNCAGVGNSFSKNAFHTFHKITPPLLSQK